MQRLIFATLIVIVCLTVSFLLSGMEVGVMALSRFRIRQQTRTGSRRAQQLHEYLERPENFLWTILVGNTLATFAGLSLVLLGLFEVVHGRRWLFLLGFAVIVCLFYAFCDLLPKMLFQQFPNRLCLALALPFRVVHQILSPLVAVVSWFSDALLLLTGGERFKGHVFGSRREMRLAIQESAQMLSSEERAMVNRVLDLQELTVRSIVVPASRAIGITTETSVRELLEVCRRHPVNRLPVWQGDGPGRRTIGIVNVNQLLFADNVPLTEIAARYAKPPLELREDVRLEDALRRMQRTRQRMAVVLSFDQRELGVVNLRDILKSIFGEVTL